MTNKKILKLVKDIKDIKIQWATNIARDAMQIFWEEISNSKIKSIAELKKFVTESDKIIRWARATEPMLFNGLNIIQKILKDLS